MKINIGGAIRKMIVTIAEVNVERIRQEEVDPVLEGIVVEVGEKIIRRESRCRRGFITKKEILIRRIRSRKGI